ncbi:DNA-directed RNA polymerase I subunit RPA12 [Strongyloides ratti]|uniref:DNA-directed RNA polymerase subunit n=1 Tax=Strongyloides ratti TaxID=34506 RepID=A0A090L4I1_STRRB|nr:DNA-directed RNA polymerase I subunit RPA12 [Strongyloides ratti]CEF63032.1 DNA-directed RNA polymerase I subunit RPA12 [Strongyloides ratti]
MFARDSEFCGRCGTFLIYPSSAPCKVECQQCSTSWKFDAINGLKVTTAKTVYTKSIADSESDGKDNGDAIVEHICPKCEFNEASYTTLQTRSADEGATIFYTCIKCKYKCIEYS